MPQAPDFPYSFRSKLPDDPPFVYSGPIYEVLGYDYLCDDYQMRSPMGHLVTVHGQQLVKMLGPLVD